MSFLDAANYWSAAHLVDCFLFTVALGSLNINLSPLASGGIVFGGGLSWELMADGAFRINDRRGGDYYDVAWDLAGSALGVALLHFTREYHQHPPPNYYEFGRSPFDRYRPKPSLTEYLRNEKAPH
jgi:hypothetical protein